MVKKADGTEHEPVESTESSKATQREMKARERQYGGTGQVSDKKKPVTLKTKIESHKSGNEAALKAAQKANRPGKSRRR